MNKLNYLNVGCGNKFHEEWFNVDLISNSPYVKSHNLLKGIPFSDNQFDVVYHSHVLEHIPREKVKSFVRECFRVLKLGGIMRVVVPDLENIVNEYIKLLHENIDNPNKQAEANYDWILLEMYDQMVRSYIGGQMAEFLRQPELINEEYIINRAGYIAKSIRDGYLSRGGARHKNRNLHHLIGIAKKVPGYILRKIKLMCSSEAARIGIFRLSGESHMWMYDRYSLSRLLKDVGFEHIEVKNPFESNVPHWDKYELDVKNGVVFDPSSLFMEAKKES